MKDTKWVSQPSGADLFERVAAILDRARGNVVRSVNTNMVLANWLIGREIVQERKGVTNEQSMGDKWFRTCPPD
ncbi:hypothetical protein SH449x_003760 [Pirellulaceae bacterium SH449]